MPKAFLIKKFRRATKHSTRIARLAVVEDSLTKPSWTTGNTLKCVYPNQEDVNQSSLSFYPCLEDIDQLKIEPRIIPGSEYDSPSDDTRYACAVTSSEDVAFGSLCSSIQVCKSSNSFYFPRTPVHLC
ncbi:uncharacterized protein LOC144439922 [Glandiceps talaboti]